MKISVVLARLREAPPSASLLVKGTDGRWIYVEDLQFSYSAPAWTTAQPSNVLVSGPVVEKA